jgi:DNA helicase IV
MNEWYNNQKKPNGNFRKLLKESIENENPRRELTAEESKRLAKLESIADKLNRGENVQNRQLQTWLSEDEYEQLDYEWKEQLELREELKDKPSNSKRYEEKLKQSTTAKTQSVFGYLKLGKKETDL